MEKNELFLESLYYNVYTLKSQESTTQQLSHKGSIHRPKVKTTLYSLIKYQTEVLLNSFHLNGHTPGYHPHT